MRKELIIGVQWEPKNLYPRGLSEILAWVRNSYLTYVILPRLSHVCCSFIVLELRHMVAK